jgi:drug/metabolite transporter (DMT)-like permease
MMHPNPTVAKAIQWFIISLAVVVVALADIWLKKAASESNPADTLRSPWLWGAVGLYLLQISLLTYAFIAGWKLSILGAIQTALYTLIVLAAGVILYREPLTRVQVVGVLLAIAGIVLINWP